MKASSLPFCCSGAEGPEDGHRGVERGIQGVEGGKQGRDKGVEGMWDKLKSRP